MFTRARRHDRSRSRRLRPGAAHRSATVELAAAVVEPHALEPEAAAAPSVPPPGLEDRVTVPDLPVRRAAPPADDDPLKLSGDFFASEFFAAPADAESVRPVATDLEPLPAREEAPLLTPELARRRRAFRRGVAGVLGAVGLMAAGAIGVTSIQSGASGVTVEATAAAAAPAAIEGAQALLPAPAPPPPAPPPPPSPAEVEAQAPADPPIAEEIAVTAPSGDAKELTAQALTLLNQGKRKDAAEVATRAIAANPADALPYLVKGSALMDLGDWPGAKAAFDACATHAKDGAVHECFAMGGHVKR